MPIPIVPVGSDVGLLGEGVRIGAVRPGDGPGHATLDVATLTAPRAVLTAFIDRYTGLDRAAGNHIRVDLGGGRSAELRDCCLASVGYIVVADGVSAVCAVRILAVGVLDEAGRPFPGLYGGGEWVSPHGSEG